MRILLIEPDTLLAETYAAALRLSDHEVDVTASAQDAVRLADENKPDAVILELQLQGHNGIEFLYEFRSYPEWLGIPIVVNSFVPPQEFTGMEVLKHELGVRQYLYKPTATISRIVACVQALSPQTSL